MGDKVLKNIAAVLSTQSRKGDILARMGGEEFALAVPNTEIDGIRLLVQRIRIPYPHSIGRTKIRPSV